MTAQLHIYLGTYRWKNFENRGSIFDTEIDQINPSKDCRNDWNCRHSVHL